MSDRRKRGRVMAVNDQAADLIRLIRDHQLIQEQPQRHFGERTAGGHTFLRRLGGQAG